MFTNEDHLQVHKKRHEMSLNLSKSGLTNANLADGFVDETPTPTRFIRNCEEVGLFQDLQNVNPFDEQFTKAASATPSHENFEFNFSDSLTKKSYDDTLNTPQVFGYTVSSSAVPASVASSVIQNPGVSTTTTSSSCSSSSISNGSSGGGVEKDVVVAVPPLNPSSSKTMAIGCTAEEAKVESTTPDNESFIPPIFTLKDDEKLDLSSSPTPVKSSSSEFMSRSIVQSQRQNNHRLPRSSNISSLEGACAIDDDETEAYSSSSSDLPKSAKAPRKEVDVKKAELLERNRAAASRSRERRKQWVSGLEGRCQTLQALYSTAQCEIAKLRAENNFFREELAKHATCDVTRAEPRSRMTVPRTPDFQPQILKHSSQSSASQLLRTSSSPGGGSSPLIVSSVAGNASTVVCTSPVITASALLKSTVPISAAPPVKPKRGRPRKGHEKRLGGISIPPVKNSHLTSAAGIPLPPATSTEMPMKVEILPVKSADGKPITSVIILKPTI